MATENVRKNPKSNKTKYAISLDDVTFDYALFHKDIFEQFELFTENHCSTESDVQLSKCYLCAVYVPQIYILDHLNSAKHAMHSKLAASAMKRVEMQRCYPLTQLDIEDRNNLHYFCDTCCVAVKSENCEEHNLTTQHIDSLKQDAYLTHLCNIYVMADKADDRKLERGDVTTVKVENCERIEVNTKTVDKIPSISNVTNKIEDIYLLGDRVENIPSLIEKIPAVKIENSEMIDDYTKTVDKIPLIGNITNKIEDIHLLGDSVEKIPAVKVENSEMIDDYTKTVDKIPSIGNITNKIEDIHSLGDKVEDIPSLIEKIPAVKVENSKMIEDYTKIVNKIPSIGNVANKIEDMHLLGDKVEDIPLLTEKIPAIDTKRVDVTSLDNMSSTFEKKPGNLDNSFNTVETTETVNKTENQLFKKTKGKDRINNFYFDTFNLMIDEENKAQWTKPKINIEKLPIKDSKGDLTHYLIYNDNPRGKLKGFIEVEALSGARAVVPLDSYHGISNSKNTLHCKLCKKLISSQEEHIADIDHKMKLRVPIYDEHFCRKVAVGLYHCLFCNDIIGDIDHHAQHSKEHFKKFKNSVRKLKKTLKLKKSDNAAYCNICSEQCVQKKEHNKTLEHKTNLNNKLYELCKHEKLKPIHYHLKRDLKVIDNINDISCRVCRKIVLFEKILEHIEDTDHKNRYQQCLKSNHIIEIDNKLFCEVCEISFHLGNELLHVGYRRHKKNLINGKSKINNKAGPSKVGLWDCEECSSDSSDSL